jgi:hypothetical protein
MGGIRWFPLPHIMTNDPPTIQHVPDLIASFPGYGRHHFVARDDRWRGQPLMIWTDK